MIIGINGPKGSGKNEVANILARNFGFETVGFADKLKQSFAALFGIEPELLDYMKNRDDARITLEWREDRDSTEFMRETSINMRTALQRYGTECHRDVFGYDFWVDSLLDNSQHFAGNLAIYDARFDNELTRIREVGGKNIQVRRPGYEFDPNHPSEHAPNQDLIDWVIPNDSTLSWLEEMVNALVESGTLGVLRQSGLTNILDPLLLPQLVPDSSPQDAA